MVATLRQLLPGLPPPRIRFDPFQDALESLASFTKYVGDPWREQARPSQLPPKWDWQIWLLMAGRGFGKTRTGAEWAREKIMFGNSPIFHFIAPTAADARDVMIEGPAGFLKVCEAYGWKRGKKPYELNYEPSKTRITCPNGAEINIFSAEEPDRLRGPQCYNLWADEIGAWKNAMYVWDMAMLGLRMGDEPQAVATTTPRPTTLVKALVGEQRDEDNPEGTVAITGGSTFENAANLARTFLSKVVKKYQGTRLGEQELLGKLLLDMPGALWTAALIEQFRIVLRENQNGEIDNPLQNMDLYRVVVGVDPMTKDPSEEVDMDNPSETGIVVCGLGPFDEGYVLDDLSAPGTPNEWGTRAVRAARLWHADHIIAEVNNGGMMVKNTIETIDPTIPVRMVHASRGKITRAEPISSLSEQGRIHMVGTFPKLEEQMTTFTGLPTAKGEKSPDRMDAFVWAMTDLMVGAGVIAEIDPYTVQNFDWMAHRG